MKSVDYHFSKFDQIIEKYGLEKIKTIGDSYMCAGGLPVATNDHAQKMLLAAIEIRDFIENIRGSEVREITDALDSIGNTTAAVGKGFAIGSAALTSLALFAAYSTAVTYDEFTLSLADPSVVMGLLIGGALPFVVAAMTMTSVGKAAGEMVVEIRRQFREIDGLLEGKEGVKPDSATCVDISTKAALREMVLPGLVAVFAPVLVGYALGASALGGMLAGALVTGVLLALFMANAGGAWDNAKKAIEQGHIEGAKKGDDAHDAAVIGDTIGDPFKDTSGPALNILIKLMSIVAVVIASGLDAGWLF